jgi:N-acetylglucosamine-6-phosphate deacetylase
VTAPETVSGRLASGAPVVVSLAAERVQAVETGSPAEDASLPWVAPGLVDLQVNGFLGLDVNDADPRPETVSQLTRALWRHGVTSWCPTVVTAGEADVLARLRAVAAAVRSDEWSAHCVLGVHVEGPHISPVEGARGVHPPEHIRPPDVAELDRWVEAADGLLAIVTLSPEWEGAPEYVAECSRRGVVAALGHTAATTEQLTACIDAGARLATHLGNGAPAMLPRHPNVIWTQLADDRLTASFIADGHHLPAATLTAMVRAKTPARSVLVSDSTALGGLPPGEYDTPVGGRVSLSPEGRLGHVGTPYLAGAASSLADGVARATELARLPLDDALRMATAHPADALGARGAGRGTLIPGAAADVLTFDWRPGQQCLQVRDVLVAGEPVVAGGRPVGPARDGA